MTKLRSFLIILVMAVIAGQSCKSSKEDLSLTVEEYQKLGMPDHTKNWTNDEFIAANIMLTTLKMHNPYSFPRKNSKKSGEIFNRLVNKDNLSFADNKELPIRTRAFMIQHWPRFQYELTQLYTDTAKNEQYYDEELIDTYILGLNIHGKMLELAGIIMNSERDEEKSIQSGLATVVFNYLKTLSNITEEQLKTNTYKAKDLDRLSKEVLGSVQNNVEWILPADRQKLLPLIQKVIDESPSSVIKNNYKQVHEVLNKK